MTTDVSAFGLRVVLVASSTFPAGVTLTQFADDGDSLDVPAQVISEQAMGLNGDLISWAKANPLLLTLNIIPRTDDDRNLQVLLEANRVGRGKTSAQDLITMTAMWPDGRSTTWTAGKLASGIPGDAAASSGRLKTKPYQFAFENFQRT